MGKYGIIWWLAIIVGVLGVLMELDYIIIPRLNSFWMVTAAFGLLVLTNFIRK
jgi:hypothetical protein